MYCWYVLPLLSSTRASTLEQDSEYYACFEYKHSIVGKAYGGSKIEPRIIRGSLYKIIYSRRIRSNYRFDELVLMSTKWHCSIDCIVSANSNWIQHAAWDGAVRPRYNTRTYGAAGIYVLAFFYKIVSS